MELSLSRQTFADALSLITEVAPMRAVRPILQNFLIQGKADNTISLSATDLEIGLKLTMPVEGIQEPDNILLPAFRMYQLIKTDKSETIKLASLGGRVKITVKQGSFDVSGISGEEVGDYPLMPDFKGDNSIFINGHDFVDAVQKTLFATAKGDTRYALNGVFVSIFDNTAEFVASDTHRLSLLKKRIRNPDNKRFDGIILSKGMSILARSAVGKETLELDIGQHEMLARTEEATFVIRKVEGQFPRYAEVIPARNENQVTFSREELLEIIQSVGIVANEETRAVTLEIGNGEMRISAINSEKGDEGVRWLDAEINGADVAIKFNFNFIVDILRHVNDDKVTIQYKNSESPVRIDSGDFSHVIMPIDR